MSLPCVEVASAPSTNAYRVNPTDLSISSGFLDILNNSDGIIKVYHGLQTEDEKQIYVFNVWENIEDHHKLQADPVVYPELGKATSTAMATKSDVVHIQPVSPPYGALEAGATELVYCTVKPGHSVAEIGELFTALIAHAESLPKSTSGVIGSTWGPVVEKPDTVSLIIGWTSVDAHWSLVKSDSTIIGILSKLSEVADLRLSHINLHLYK